MVWWGVLITIVATMLVTGIVVYVLSRKSTLAVDREGLAASERKAWEERVAAEKTARRAVEDAARSLAAERKKISEWYNNAKGDLDAKARDDFSALSTDPAAIDDWLDGVLGTASDDDPREDDTPKGG